MFKKRLFRISVFCLLLLFIFYKQGVTADVYGIVKDSVTGLPLAGVSLVILETGDSTVTNASGEYFLPNIPDGFYTFMVGQNEYEPKIMLNVSVGSCCLNRGNVDGVIGSAGPVDVSDLTYLVAFLFQGGYAPPCIEEGNVDGVIGGAGLVDVADLTYLVAFLFQGGTPPPACI